MLCMCAVLDSSLEKTDTVVCKKSQGILIFLHTKCRLKNQNTNISQFHLPCSRSFENSRNFSPILSNLPLSSITSGCKSRSRIPGLVWYLLGTVYCMKNCMQYAVYRTILHAVCSILQVKLHDAVQKTRCFTYCTTPGLFMRVWYYIFISIHREWLRESISERVSPRE